MRCEVGRLRGSAHGRSLHCNIANGRVELAKRFARTVQDVLRQLPGARAGLNQRERLRPSEKRPHLVKLAREQTAKQRSHVNARYVVTPFALIRSCVVAELRMI